MVLTVLELLQGATCKEQGNNACPKFCDSQLWPVKILLNLAKLNAPLKTGSYFQDYLGRCLHNIERLKLTLYSYSIKPTPHVDSFSDILSPNGDIIQKQSIIVRAFNPKRFHKRGELIYFNVCSV